MAVIDEIKQRILQLGSGSVTSIYRKLAIPTSFRLGHRLAHKRQLREPRIHISLT